jgi:dipeptidyl aminopeptidase/acylaminoacyl peptidase
MGRLQLIALLIVTCTVLSPRAGAQPPYREPPAEIVNILDAAPLPWVSTSPVGDTLVLLERETLPPIRELAQPMLRLAGQRVNPATNARFGPRSVVGMTLVDVASGEQRVLELDGQAGYGFPLWSVDGAQVAFTVTTGTGVSLSLASIAEGSVRSLSGPVLNTLGVGPQWLPGRVALLVGFIPSDRGAAPVRSPVPTGPVIQENLGGEPAPVRTYQDLLRDAYDERLYEHHFTTQLAIVDAATGEASPIGPPGLYVSASPSPDGRFLLVERIEGPFSYLVPWYRFPQRVEVWDLDGVVVAELARLPLAERIPIQGVITGPRHHAWRASEGTADVVWVEALDGGDPKREVQHRDKLWLLAAPFDGAPREIARLEDRSRGLAWLESGSHALVTEYDRDERWTRSWLVDVRPDTDSAPRLVFDRSVQDRYGDPGTPLTTTNAAGRSVLLQHDGQLMLAGRGASDEGDRPFLDALDPFTGEKTRLWRNAGEEYETVIDLLEAGASGGDAAAGAGGRGGTAGKLAILTRRETPSSPPNYHVRSLPLDGSPSTRWPITRFEHPAPQLRDVQKELVTYARDDGVRLSATLYLPPGHSEGDTHPLLVWAYPREFNDPSMASQVSGSPWRFTMFGGSSHLFLLTQGYAIMDGATMPVVGSDPETVNDSFIQQIVDSAAAAIQLAVERGVADGQHVGVGGHSYGAFMTANLLAHCDLFQAGVARSGAYNRTLTPFGFQAERRTFWEAPETYFALSPFMHADDINEPLLMIHGMEDNNSGTFPLQSERMYHAIKGHGGTARLVMLPEESHGYRARESVLHTLAEMNDWFDRWLKDDPDT